MDTIREWWGAIMAATGLGVWLVRLEGASKTALREISRLEKQLDAIVNDGACPSEPTTVLDLTQNGSFHLCILDASGACHMPDVLEMPYRPPLMDSGEPGEKKYTYRLSSCTCLAGDVIGDYSFDREIKTGDRLCFCDMAIYSMVKNNTFNGMPLPDIAVMDENNDCKVIRRFEYEDFKCRLS